ncbi:MAG: Crp/Fnr family transcriptional regulator [Nitrospinaceae bacterium]
MAAKIEILKNIPLFSSLDEKHIEELASIAVEKHFRKNQIIFNQDDTSNALFIIKAGMVKISIADSNNNEFILKMIAGNDFFGEMSLLDGKPRSATATAVEECKTLIIHREDFIRLIQKNPAVALALMTILAVRLRYTTENISNLTFYDAYGKVAKCLLYLKEKIGRQEDEKIVLNLKISRQELANLAGITRETFTRILREFQSRGCIQVTGKDIVILDESILKREIIL